MPKNLHAPKATLPGALQNFGRGEIGERGREERSKSTENVLSNANGPGCCSSAGSACGTCHDTIRGAVERINKNREGIVNNFRETLQELGLHQVVTSEQQFKTNGNPIQHSQDRESSQGKIAEEINSTTSQRTDGNLNAAPMDHRDSSYRSSVPDSGTSAAPRAENARVHEAGSRVSEQAPLSSEARPPELDLPSLQRDLHHNSEKRVSDASTKSGEGATGLNVSNGDSAIDRSKEAFGAIYLEHLVPAAPQTEFQNSQQASDSVVSGVRSTVDELNGSLQRIADINVSKADPPGVLNTPADSAARIVREQSGVERFKIEARLVSDLSSREIKEAIPLLVGEQGGKQLVANTSPRELRVVARSLIESASRKNDIATIARLPQPMLTKLMVRYDQRSALLRPSAYRDTAKVVGREVRVANRTVALRTLVKPVVRERLAQRLRMRSAVLRKIRVFRKIRLLKLRIRALSKSKRSLSRRGARGKIGSKRLSKTVRLKRLELNRSKVAKGRYLEGKRPTARVLRLPGRNLRKVDRLGRRVNTPSLDSLKSVSQKAYLSVARKLIGRALDERVGETRQASRQQMERPRRMKRVSPENFERTNRLANSAKVRVPQRRTMSTLRRQQVLGSHKDRIKGTTLKLNRILASKIMKRELMRLLEEQVYKLLTQSKRKRRRGSESELSESGIAASRIRKKKRADESSQPHESDLEFGSSMKLEENRRQKGDEDQYMNDKAAPPAADQDNSTGFISADEAGPDWTLETVRVKAN